MMESLEGLKETDPEFYKYLKQNDQGLLDFQVSDLSDDNDDNDQEKDSNTFDSESDEGDKFPKEVDEDEDDEDDEDEDDQDEKILIEVTSATIEEWKTLLTETHSISALKGSHPGPSGRN